MISQKDIEKFESAKVALGRAKTDIDLMERALVLMEAGLEKRPLDRDLFELMKHKHQDRKDKFEMDSGLLTVLDKIVADQKGKQ